MVLVPTKLSVGPTFVLQKIFFINKLRALPTYFWFKSWHVLSKQVYINKLAKLPQAKPPQSSAASSPWLNSNVLHSRHHST